MDKGTKPARLERINIETTSACNIKCLQCTVSLPDYHQTYGVNTLSQAILDQIIPVLKRDRPLVYLHGHGETFLYKDFIGTLKRVIDIGCEVQFLTNATLLTPERIVSLLDFAGEGKLSSISISMDAAEKELFEKIRVGACYDAYIKNIKNLQQMKRARELKYPQLNFIMVAMLMNIHQLPEVVRVIHNLGGVHLTVANLKETDKVIGQRIDKDLTYSLPFIDEAAKLALELGVGLTFVPSIEQLRLFQQDTLNGNHFYEKNMGVSNVQDESFAKGIIRIKDCNDPWSFVFIKSNGDVYPCCSGSSPLGNLKKTPFYKIWESQAYQERRASIASSNPPEECHNCMNRGWIFVPYSKVHRGATSKTWGSKLKRVLLNLKKHY